MDKQAMLKLITRYTEACDDLGADLFHQTVAEHERKLEAARKLWDEIEAELGKVMPQTLPQPVTGHAGFDLIGHLQRQMDFSARTFGPGARTEGVCDHIRKELVEVQDDAAAGKPVLHEWIDVIILGFDGAWRAAMAAQPNLTFREAADWIVAELVAKQAKNERRTWPDWRTAPAGRAIEHVRGAED